MFFSWGQLLKRDVWKLLILLILLALFWQLPVFAQGIFPRAALLGKPVVLLLLAGSALAQMLVFSVLGVLPYWAASENIKSNKKPLIQWTVFCVIYVLLGLLLAFLMPMMLNYGNMPMSDVSNYMSYCVMAYAIVRDWLFVVFLAVIFAVLEKTSLSGGFYAAQRHWKGILLIAFCFMLIALAGGGLAKWMSYPRFIPFAVLWILAVYAFAACRRLENG